MGSNRRAGSAAKPASLPVLPLRDTVHFPGQVHTLHVARERSKRAVREAQSAGSPLLALCQTDMQVEEPRADQLHRIGVLSDVVQVISLPDGSLRVALRAKARAIASKMTARAGCLFAQFEPCLEEGSTEAQDKALMRLASAAFGELVELDAQIPAESIGALAFAETPGTLADTMAHHLTAGPKVKQRLLEILEPSARLRSVYEEVREELAVARLQREIAQRVEGELGESQRQFYLREQLRAIQSELGGGAASEEIAELKRDIERAGMPEALRARAMHELERLEWLGVGSAEAGPQRTYLEWLISLPWNSSAPEVDSMELVESELEASHFGLRSVKDRILEYLAVRKLSRGLRAPALCFTGSPGMGKTSVARSIAAALGRPFVQISLGGLRDEAEIRGHRRTYVGAMPGRLIRELRFCAANNPVVLLDEIDKLGSDFRGDPAAALLEALDPSLNGAFIDHYIEAPFDLSRILFIATANRMDGVLPALKDRLEVIEFPSYSDRERMQITAEYLIPKLTRAHGLEGVVAWDAQAMSAVASRFGAGAGVRGIEQAIQQLCRKAARHHLRSGEPVVIDANQVETWLGAAEDQPDRVADVAWVGVCHGVGVSDSGGRLMRVECAGMEPLGSAPEVRVTGNLGEVMRESVHAAMTYLRRSEPGLLASARRDQHIHVGEGGMPKDGPSAGLAVAISMWSEWTGCPVPEWVAATGEITLNGAVRPVGMLRDKALAAMRAGVRVMIAPAANRPELLDWPAEVQDGLTWIWVDQIAQAIQAIQELPSGVAKRQVPESTLPPAR